MCFPGKHGFDRLVKPGQRATNLKLLLPQTPFQKSESALDGGRIQPGKRAPTEIRRHSNRVSADFFWRSFWRLPSRKKHANLKRADSDSGRAARTGNPGRIGGGCSTSIGSTANHNQIDSSYRSKSIFCFDYRHAVYRHVYWPISDWK